MIFSGKSDQLSEIFFPASAVRDEDELTTGVLLDGGLAAVVDALVALLAEVTVDVVVVLLLAVLGVALTDVAWPVGRYVDAVDCRSRPRRFTVGSLLFSCTSRGDGGTIALVQVPARRRPCVRLGCTGAASVSRVSCGGESLESSRLLRESLRGSDEDLSMAVLSSSEEVVGLASRDRLTRLQVGSGLQFY